MPKDAARLLEQLSESGRSPNCGEPLGTRRQPSLRLVAADARSCRVQRSLVGRGEPGGAATSLTSQLTRNVSQ